MQSVTSTGGNSSREPEPESPDDRHDDDAPVVLVRITDLALGLSPRLEGEHERHARLLAETDATLPPILVHHATMRVIDGMHRVCAARMKGQETIRAQFYEGSENAAFVLAVQRNITHGLPLSMADRKAAASRIVSSHPHWSDRAIAARTGLSARTIQSVRRCSTADSPPLSGRVGQDGRFRPINVAEGRLRASEIIRAQPTVALRTVAKAAGVSLGTAHDVRERLRRGDDPVPARHRADSGSEHPVETRRQRRPARPPGTRDLRVILESLQRDPSMKFTGSGRSALRWLWLHAIEARDWALLLDSLPAHTTEAVAELAWSSAEAWQEFARELTQRSCMTG